MLRICARSCYAPSLSVFHSTVRTNSSLQPLSVCANILSRHLSTKNVEKQKGDDKFHVVYYGPLTPQIRAVKMFSLGSSIAGLFAQPIILREASTIGSTSLLIAICSVVGFFTFVTPLLLHLITKKYVTEIECDPATTTYKAKTISFFMKEKTLEFQPVDVEVPDIPGMFTSIYAKKKPLFIEARFFNDPLHFAKIMGYDKPMDFKLGNKSHNTDSSK